ncbi:MAG TPA: hypothetical protein VEY31_04320, partial [Roseococcus sp.]|nr:hypothetical protein [Roseococcus sp.]
QGADGAPRQGDNRGDNRGPRRDDRPRFEGPRRDGPRPPRRDDRDGGRGSQRGGPETRTFHEDRPTTSAEDSPFAALMKLKLK